MRTAPDCLSTTKARVALNFLALPWADCAETAGVAVSETITNVSAATAAASIARRDLPDIRVRCFEAALLTAWVFIVPSLWNRGSREPRHSRDTPSVFRNLAVPAY